MRLLATRRKGDSGYALPTLAPEVMLVQVQCAMKKMSPMKPMSPFPPMRSQTWWPEDLGTPSSSGSSDDLRYAYFPVKNRLLVERTGKATMFDTGDHQFRGALQKSGLESDLSFETQRGRVALGDLKVVPLP